MTARVVVAALAPANAVEASNAFWAVGIGFAVAVGAGGRAMGELRSTPAQPRTHRSRGSSRSRRRSRSTQKPDPIRTPSTLRAPPRARAMGRLTRWADPLPWQPAVSRADLPCVTGRFPVRRPSGSGSLAAASASCGVLFSSLVDGLDGSPSTSALLLDAPCKRGALLPPPVLVALPGTGASPVTTVSARKAVRCGRGPKLSSAMQALPSRHAATSLGHRRRRSALGGARVWPFAPGGAMCRAPQLLPRARSCTRTAKHGRQLYWGPASSFELRKGAFLSSSYRLPADCGLA